ncbi:hypothetical protein JOF41_004763 [Saccharothrix coeruleofusca]|uniref:hypothetical protein n=1 Tax=Saccharothrix coeruleofusca TaxID=33919 RepID=UPI001AE42774|nr:hypothetical protein [Saccharothrix coeruleofusca]MBP2338585.1 hypothetical protein [Saccharothrix coeruleofusca]
MRRLLLLLVPFLLLACSAEQAPPAPTSAVVDELAALAEKVDARRAELRTARFHTEGFASDGEATEVGNVVDGALRQDPEGLVGSMSMDVTTGGQSRRIDLVIVRDGMYVSVAGAPMPEGKKWGYYTEQNSGDLSALLRGFGPGSTVGAELDYVQPRAAAIVGKAEEELDGTPVTRYDLVVDPVKMAKVIEDPDIQLQHAQLAEHGVAIRATVRVDATGAPLQAEYRFELDGKVVKRSATRFRDWGQPIDIPVPPEAEVVPADQLPSR